ncbi:MAG: phosphoglycerate kinase [bacterium]|nr:phosphoglycerate kinase [bacterium]
MHSVRDADLIDKTVIVWTDLDVPLENGQVVEKARLLSSSKTIKFLLEQKAKVILLGHLGRPEGRDPNFSLKPVVASLSQLVGKPIELLSEVQKPTSDLACLENIRFWPEEEAREENFAKQVALLGECYVNDCFATSHHAGATMLFLPKFLPPFIGIALEEEVHELASVMRNPKRPLVAILAGAKLETKLPAITNMSKIADKVLVAGKLMFEFKEKISNVIVASDDVDGADIGPVSIQSFQDEIAKAATVVWNGTMGKYEDERYLNGTKAIAQAVVASGCYSVVGGGDTAAALSKIGLLSKIAYVSMGGGAMLDFLAGKKLAGLEAIGYYD